MPVIVDHEARKAFLAEVTADLIASKGLEATTIRTVASSAGYSTSIITHYFQDKSQLLKQTYVAIAARRRVRLLELAANAPDPLLACALALLPIGREARRDWLVYCAFLASGIAHRQLSEVQGHWIAQTIAAFRDLMPAGRGKTNEPSGPDDEAIRLVSLITGLSVLHVLDPEAHSESRMADLVRQEIDALRA